MLIAGVLVIADMLLTVTAIIVNLCLVIAIRKTQVRNKHTKKEYSHS